MPLREKITAWINARNTCAEAKIHLVDAEGADECGCHVLAELLRLRDELEHARGPISGREVVVWLAPIIALARGEAQDKLRAALEDESIVVPGVVSFKR